MKDGKQKITGNLQICNSCIYDSCVFGATVTGEDGHNSLTLCNIKCNGDIHKWDIARNNDDQIMRKHLCHLGFKIILKY